MSGGTDLVSTDHPGSTELETIREQFRNDPRALDDPKLMARQLALLERQHGSRRELAEFGPTDDVAGYTAAKMIVSLDETDARDLAGGFQRLPDGAQTAIWSELAEGVPHYVEPFSEQQVDEIRSIPIFWAMCRRWGLHDSQRYLAIVWTRIFRCHSVMDDNEAAQATHWFDSLNGEQLRVVLNFLSGRGS
jgi:hypothetical protein